MSRHNQGVSSNMPEGAIRVNGAMTRLSPSLMRTVVRALVDYHGKQGERVQEAVAEAAHGLTDIGHADIRSKKQFIAAELLGFLEEAGVPMPEDYRPTRSTTRDLAPAHGAAAAALLRVL